MGYSGQKMIDMTKADGFVIQPSFDQDLTKLPVPWQGGAAVFRMIKAVLHSKW